MQQQLHQNQQNNNLAGSQGNAMEIEDKNDMQNTHFPGK